MLAAVGKPGVVAVGVGGVFVGCAAGGRAKKHRRRPASGSNAEWPQSSVAGSSIVLVAPLIHHAAASRVLLLLISRWEQSQVAVWMFVMFNDNDASQTSTKRAVAARPTATISSSSTILFLSRTNLFPGLPLYDQHCPP